MILMIQDSTTISQNFRHKFRGNIDLLVGGSPCQAFSMVGNRKGFEDPGNPFYEFMKLLTKLIKSFHL